MAVNTFDPNRTAFARRMADGHYARTGHELAGYYVYSGNVATLIRTCACADNR